MNKSSSINEKKLAKITWKSDAGRRDICFVAGDNLAEVESIFKVIKAHRLVGISSSAEVVEVEYLGMVYQSEIDEVPND